jgi:hypothetical protein
VTAAPGATVDAGMLDWDDPLLASGATVTYPVTLKVGATMQSIVALGGAAGGDGPDPYPMNNAAITTIQLG